MKKQIVALILLLIMGTGATAHISYNLGHLKGEEDVILNQNVYGSEHTFYTEYDGRVDSYYYEENSMTVKAITQLMSEEWQNVVIKDNGYIVYDGNVQDLHDEEILNCHVQEVASCEDDFAITIFIE